MNCLFLKKKKKKFQRGDQLTRRDKILNSFSCFQFHARKKKHYFVRFRIHRAIYGHPSYHFRTGKKYRTTTDYIILKAIFVILIIQSRYEVLYNFPRVMFIDRRSLITKYLQSKLS